MENRKTTHWHDTFIELRQARLVDSQPNIPNTIYMWRKFSHCTFNIHERDKRTRHLVKRKFIYTLTHTNHNDTARKVEYYNTHIYKYKHTQRATSNSYSFELDGAFTKLMMIIKLTNYKMERRNV